MSDDEKDVVGFKIDIPEDPKAALQGVEKGLVAYDSKAKINQGGQVRVADFVFIMEDAVSADLEVGAVSSIQQKAGVSFLKVDGEWEEVDLDNTKTNDAGYKTHEDLGKLVKQFIVFQRTENEEIVIRGSIATTDLAGASTVIASKDLIVRLKDGRFDGKFDMSNNDDPLIEAYDDYQIVYVKATTNKVENKENVYEIEFVDGENLGTGLTAGSSKYSKGVRLLSSEDIATLDEDVVFVIDIDEIDENDIINPDGTATLVDKDQEDSGDNNEVTSGEKFTVSYKLSGDAINGWNLPEDVEVESGDPWTAERIADYEDASGNKYTFTVEPASIDAVTEDTKVVITYVMTPKTVTPVITRVEVTSDATALESGETLQLTAKSYSGDTVVEDTYTWASSDETVATVSDSGLVSGLKSGDVTITATSNTVNTISGSKDLHVSGDTL